METEDTCVKKYLLLIISIALIFSLCGCNSSPPQDLNDETEMHITEDQLLLTDSKGIVENHNGGYTDTTLTGEIPLLTIEDIDMYNKFISQTDLPENFVYYNDIKEFGEFDTLVFLCDIRRGEYTEYMYDFRDENAGRFSLFVKSEPPKKFELTSQVITNVNRSDMRTLDSEQSGTYTHENIDYVFIKGKLLSIEWKSGGLYYTISSIGDLNDDIGGFNISKLFDLGTAVDFISAVTPIETKK